jgi:soluble lytic murein transglycosylase-like protein
MVKKDFFDIFYRISMSENIDPDLVMAIAGKESDFNQYACRYEAGWTYLVSPKKFADSLRITEDTEIQFQKFSYGSMQIMGSVARELGFIKPLPLLLEAENGIIYGCKFLKKLQKKFSTRLDIISAYNQGYPFKEKDGSYKNQKYVDGVLDRLKKLKAIP